MVSNSKTIKSLISKNKQRRIKMKQQTKAEGIITDLGTAAFLSMYFPSFWIGRDNPQKYKFIFDISKEPELFGEMKMAYLSKHPNSMVIAMNYYEAIKSLKSRMYNE